MTSLEVVSGETAGVTPGEALVSSGMVETMSSLSLAYTIFTNFNVQCLQNIRTRSV